MRSDLNLAVQIAAVGGCVLMRLLSPGWLLVIFFIFVPVGTVALIAQIVLASVAVRRRRLPTGVSVAFGLLAASLLGAAAVIPDGGDSERSISSPLGLLLGAGLPDLTPIGMCFLVTWLGALIWTIVGLATSRPTPPPPVPYRYWSGPAPAGLG